MQAFLVLNAYFGSLFVYADCCQPAKVGISHNISNLMEPITNYTPRVQVVHKFGTMTFGARIKRLISSFYSNHAPKPTLLSAFTHFLLCRGKPKAYSLPLELSISMQVLAMLLRLATILIKSQIRMPIPGIR